jgi:hypothetical protein
MFLAGPVLWVQRDAYTARPRHGACGAPRDGRNTPGKQLKYRTSLCVSMLELWNSAVMHFCVSLLRHTVDVSAARHKPRESLRVVQIRRSRGSAARLDISRVDVTTR